MVGGLSCVWHIAMEKEEEQKPQSRAFQRQFQETTALSGVQ